MKIKAMIWIDMLKQIITKKMKIIIILIFLKMIKKLKLNVKILI